MFAFFFLLFWLVVIEIIICLKFCFLMLNIASERKHKNINDSYDKSTQAEARISQFYHLPFHVCLLSYVCWFEGIKFLILLFGAMEWCVRHRLNLLASTSVFRNLSPSHLYMEAAKFYPKNEVYFEQLGWRVYQALLNVHTFYVFLSRALGIEQCGLGY